MLGSDDSRDELVDILTTAPSRVFVLEEPLPHEEAEPDKTGHAHLSVTCSVCAVIVRAAWWDRHVSYMKRLEAVLLS